VTHLEHPIDRRHALVMRGAKLIEPQAGLVDLVPRPRVALLAAGARPSAHTLEAHTLDPAPEQAPQRNPDQ
jgi:hypothetical protein